MVNLLGLSCHKKMVQGILDAEMIVEHKSENLKWYIFALTKSSFSLDDEDLKSQNEFKLSPSASFSSGSAAVRVRYAFQAGEA